MDDPKRGHRSVLVAALIALAVAAIIWGWLTARGSATGFPQPILTAEGLLLTALVFVAGLGQGNVRRATDAALAELHRRDDSMLGSYTDHTSPVPTLKLFEWATLAEREIQ